MSYENKMRILLEALEIENVPGFMENAEEQDYYEMGKIIADSYKALRKKLENG